MPTRITPTALRVLLLVEAEGHLRSTHEDRAADQVRLLHHEIDCFLLRLRQRPLFEYRATRAHESEEPILVDVLLEKRAVRRVAIDVALVDVKPVLLQITSGVAARRSRGLPEKCRLGHGDLF